MECGYRYRQIRIISLVKDQIELRSVDIKSTNTAGGCRDLSSFYRSPRDPGLFSPQVSCLDPANPGPCLRSITAVCIVNR